MTTKRVIEDLTVVRNTRLNQRHFLLELSSQEQLPGILPGQFVQVLVENSKTTFLRRPFSIHTINFPENTISLLIQIKGEGTKHLGYLQPGAKLNVIYPLGNSFSVPTGKKALLVGGGCGVAPLLYLAQYLHAGSVSFDILTGWRSMADIFELDLYSRYGNVLVTTEDGSEGERGFVTDHSLFRCEPFPYDYIYCCGPDAMMKAVSKIAGNLGIGCEVSLENTMACGFGVCLCCVTPTTDGNQRVCIEGPVFKTTELGW